VRFEDFSDFGTTTNGKIAARLKVTDGFSLRASASTGFRAPTTGQSNVRNVSTSFFGGVLSDEATLPPTNPISVQKGGKPLQPEESVGLTIGAVWGIGNLDLTIDYFNISIDDRMTLSSSQALTQQDIDDLLDQGVTDASSFSAVRFFTNGFETTTQGVDLVATMPIGDTMDITLSGNWTDNQVDRVDELAGSELLSSARIRQLEDGVPDVRVSLTGNHDINNWFGLWRINYWGSYFEDHVDAACCPIEGSSATTVDAEIGYTFNDSIRVVVGAQNLLDEEPDLNPWGPIVVGAKFPVTAPYGFNGAFYYLRASWDIY
jgi:iron complex outermembrane receptor protein